MPRGNQPHAYARAGAEFVKANLDLSPNTKLPERYLSAQAAGRGASGRYIVVKPHEGEITREAMHAALQTQGINMSRGRGGHSVYPHPIAIVHTKDVQTANMAAREHFKSGAPSGEHWITINGAHVLVQNHEGD